MRHTIRFLMGSGVGVAVAGLPVFAQVPLTKVIMAGEAAPGGGTISSIVSVSIGPSGHLAIRGRVTGAGNLDVILAGLPGQLERVATQGEAAPGLSDAQFLGFTNIVIDSGGRVAFTATLTGTNVTTDNNSGIWLFSSGTTGLVARRGGPAPITPSGTTFTSLGAPRLSNGRLAFVSTLGGNATTTNNRAIWQRTSTAFTLVARTGSPAPLAGDTFKSLSDPVINSAGQMGFAAGSGPAAVAGGDDVMIFGAPGALVEVAREVGLIPDPALSGLRYNQLIGSPSINDAGEFAFTSTLTGTGVTSANFRAAFRRSAAGVLTAISRQGSPVTDLGLTPNPTIGDFGFFSLGGAGQVCWTTNLASATLGAPDRTCSLRLRPAGLASVVRSGTQAPAEAAGVVFGNAIQPDQTGMSLSINGSGVMTMLSGVRGPGVEPSNFVGLWASNPGVSGGAAFRVVREGDSATVSPGVVRFVDQVGVASAGGTQEGEARVLNDAGTVAVVLTFSTAETGVFTGSITAAPPALGACCVGSTCASAAAAACTGAGVHFAGAGTVCNAAGNTESPCCIADFNHTGGVSLQDLFDFLAAWFASTASADANGSGGVTLQDLFDFLAAWFAGCG